MGVCSCPRVLRLLLCIVGAGCGAAQQADDAGPIYECGPRFPPELLQGFDLAYVGFFKAGSTSFRKLFAGHPDVRMYENPHHDRFERHRLAKEHEQREAYTASWVRRVLIVETFVRLPGLLRCLRRQSPRVKLLVSVREPMAWLQSLYNFVLWQDSTTSEWRVPHRSIPPFDEVAQGADFGNSRFSLVSALLHRQLERVVRPGMQPPWGTLARSARSDGFVELAVSSQAGFNFSSELLVVDLASFSEEGGPRVIKTLERFLGVQRPFPPEVAAVLTRRSSFQNAHRDHSQVANAARFVDLCLPEFAHDLEQLVDFYREERAELRALLSSPVGSGVVSRSMHSPGEAL